MKLQSFLQPLAKPKEVIKRINDVSRIVNSLDMGSPQNGSINLQGFWVDTTTPSSANTEFTITHNLDKIPVGIIVVSLDQASIIYASRRAQWTTTQAFFKADQASVALVGFVI